MKHIIGFAVLLAHATAHDECLNSLRAPPGYDPTKCHALNATKTLPTQCLGPKWSLDPPCPRCWSNDASDFVPGVSPTSLWPELRASMAAALPRYLDHMEATHPPDTHRTSSGTVFSGVGGRALLLLKLHELTRNVSYLESAQAYTKAMLSKLPKQKFLDLASGAVGFQWSHVGMLCVAAVSASRRGDTAAASDFVEQVRKVFEAAARGASGRYDDFDSGRAGLLYAGRFLESNLATNLTAAPLIPRELVVGVATAIIDRGAATGSARGHTYMEWHGPNDAGLWLGQSHGAAGVLQMLLEVPELLSNSTAVSWMRRTLDHIVSTQFASGNFPTEYYNATEDFLVQWDHGAAGVSATLILAWRAFDEPTYKAAALRALDVTWRRGLVLKGLMNCHGISGNSWMQFYAARQLIAAGAPNEADKYIYRGLSFQQTVLSHPILSGLTTMRQPQPMPEGPWSFWTGSVESAVELWADLLHRGPANVSLTGWQAEL